jgi:Icc-related predicted phosphoesterase
MDESIVIAGKKFYGSPWQPWFYNWAFNVERGPLIAEKWALIPDDTDVLITHGPAFAPPGLNYGGIVARGEDVGCKDLSARIFDIKPQYHICGHIHESYCAYREEAIGTTFVNASSCDLHYRLTRTPWILPL